jgi:release factor glutamine methyltransferase
MPESDTASQEEWTIRRLLAWTQAHFEAKWVDEPRLAAELLLAEALGCKRIELYLRYDQVPTPAQRSAYREMVRAAAEHKPIAHLTGHREFYSLDFIVTPDVLIPRPETELLVERALAYCREHPRERFHLLDVGTGSGCIAVTIAKRQPAVHAVGTDVSAAALAVAARNAERHGVKDRLRLIQADMLELPAEVVPEHGFDLILSNPPYVAQGERERLPENVRQYEPGVALFGGADGLQAYHRISRDVGRFLRPGGTLIVEVGYEQADAVQALLAAGGSRLALLGRYKDLGGIDRALQFTLPT